MLQKMLLTIAEEQELVWQTKRARGWLICNLFD